MERWTRRRFLKGTLQAAASGTAMLGTSCGRKGSAFDRPSHSRMKK